MPIKGQPRKTMNTNRKRIHFASKNYIFLNLYLLKLSEPEIDFDLDKIVNLRGDDVTMVIPIRASGSEFYKTIGLVCFINFTFILALRSESSPKRIDWIRQSSAECARDNERLNDGAKG